MSGFTGPAQTISKSLRLRLLLDSHFADANRGRPLLVSAKLSWPALDLQPTSTTASCDFVGPRIQSKGRAPFAKAKKLPTRSLLSLLVNLLASRPPHVRTPFPPISSRDLIPHLLFLVMSTRRIFARALLTTASRPRIPTLRNVLMSAKNLPLPGSARRSSTATIDYPMTHDRIACPTDTKYFIDNKLLESKTAEWIDLYDPATNNLVTRVPQSTNDELQAAVDSAAKAFPKWKATSLLARQQVMFRFTNLIRENWDKLAASITLEQGKTFADAKGDVLRGLQVAEVILLRIPCNGSYLLIDCGNSDCLWHHYAIDWRGAGGCQRHGN